MRLVAFRKRLGIYYKKRGNILPSKHVTFPLFNLTFL